MNPRALCEAEPGTLHCPEPIAEPITQPTAARPSTARPGARTLRDYDCARRRAFSWRCRPLRANTRTTGSQTFARATLVHLFICVLGPPFTEAFGEAQAPSIRPSLIPGAAVIEVVMSTKLYVGNLGFSTTESTVHDAFAEFGQVVSVALITDRATGQSRGFGFVEYDSADAAQRAIETMNGAMLDGRALNVNIAREREGGGGSSRGPRPDRSARRW